MVNNFIQQARIPVIAFSQLNPLRHGMVAPTQDSFYGCKDRVKLATCAIGMTKDFSNNREYDKQYATLFFILKDRHDKTGKSSGFGVRKWFDARSQDYTNEFYDITFNQDGTKIKDVQK
jgi:hypothetical protein